MSGMNDIWIIENDRDENLYSLSGWIIREIGGMFNKLNVEYYNLGQIGSK